MISLSKFTENDIIWTEGITLTNDCTRFRCKVTPQKCKKMGDYSVHLEDGRVLSSRHLSFHMTKVSALNSFERKLKYYEREISEKLSALMAMQEWMDEYRNNI